MKHWHSMRRLFGTSTVKGFTKLAGGTATAQLVVVAAAPVLTRLYTPEDMGVLATYMALSLILITVSAGRYELAIMLPEEEREATQLAALSLLLVVCTSLVTLLGVAMLGAFQLFPSDWNLGAWIFLIPATVLIGGGSAVFVAAATRRGEFGLIGTTSVARQLVGVTAQIVLGLLKFAPGGLLVGGFLGVGAANARLGRPVVRQIRETRPSRREIRGIARRYSHFPRYTLPAGLLSSLYLRGAPLLIGAMFGAATLGLWSLAYRVLSLPAAVVGEAAAQSYFKTAASLRGDPRRALRLYDWTVLGLAGVSALPFAILLIWGAQLFGLVFGPDWEEAGQYARLMIPLLWVRFAVSPISRTFLVYEKNRIGVFVQGAQLTTLLGSGGAALVLDLSFNEFLLLFSVSSACVYLVVFYWARRVIATSSPAHA